MAAIDYWGIREGIKNAILAHEPTEEATIYIEDEFIYSSEATPAVVIYLDSRDAAEDDQPIRAGTAVRYLLRFTVWVHEFSLESPAQAIRQRDTFLAELEIAFLKDRTLQDKVTTSWIEGGEMFSAQTDQGEELASAEIIFMVDVTATTA